MSDSLPALQTDSTPAHLHTVDPLTRRHLAIGWWSLLIFLTFGIVLEALHGFKVGGYLNVSASTRRLMWTLAHAHGTLLALVHLGFAASLSHLPGWPANARKTTGGLLTAGSLLVPTGFFLGGMVIHGGDPGLGILLVPAGAVLLLVSVFNAARQCLKR